MSGPENGSVNVSDTKITEKKKKKKKGSEDKTSKKPELDFYMAPDFIYGGPFIEVQKASPFWDLGTPMNTTLQGTFKKSFAFFSLKERLPVILTKVIDYLARDGTKIASKYNTKQNEIIQVIQNITKLKNDLVTNKEYDPFTMKTPEAEKWNKWIELLDTKKYFLNSWMFTECYVYWKLKEGFELVKGLQQFDYFAEQKNKAFDNNVEIMCIVADRVVTMMTESEKDKRKADFVTLLKLCLWSNKCDLSLSLGSEVNLIKAAADETERLRLNPPPPPSPPKGKKKKTPTVAGPIIISSDPFQMILDLKDKVIADDCNKIADQVQSKAEKIREKIIATQEALVFKAQCSCNRVAKQAGMKVCEPPPEEVEEPVNPPRPKGMDPGETGPNSNKRIPCPAKITVPSAVFFDIVCDNAGYELFADLCLAHFLVAQKIVQKVRFHVKNIPWFVSDVTRSDFSYLIDACLNCQFSAPSTVTGGNKPSDPESSEPQTVTADNLRTLGQQWEKYVQDGIFLLMSDDFWTYPHCFKDMKSMDPYLFRKLQTGVACMFKGDLNYRKLIGDRNINPMTKFQAAMADFKPAPIIALRTVKSEIICGLGRGKYDQITNIDPKWMQTGNYGVIQFAPKGDALKVSDKPCVDYCTTCFGVICPEHFDM